MLEKAIEKIKSEMEKAKDDLYISVIGEFLLQYINSNPEASDKILAKDKSIEKSLDEMKNIAKKKVSKGVAMLTDQEGFTIVLQYFGIIDKPKSSKGGDVKDWIKCIKQLMGMEPVLVIDETPVIADAKKAVDIDFDLDIEDLF